MRLSGRGHTGLAPARRHGPFVLILTYACYLFSWGRLFQQVRADIVWFGFAFPWR